MNNYHVSIDLTISTGVNSSLNLVDFGYEVVRKITKSIGSSDEANIQINKITTDVINRLPLYAIPPAVNIKKGSIEPDEDDDDEYMLLDPEYGDYLDEDDQ